MGMTGTAGPSAPEKKYLTVRQAAFIGVGAMVGAGIFALLGAAGAVAGAAVWLSFLLAGVVAGLQGYSFAKLGARYPSAGGLLEYVAEATGNGHRRLAGVFGTLTVDKVISSVGTAIAVAAEPVLGRAGYWLMTVTALFATAGATNAGLYPAVGLSDRLAETGQFPPLMARRAGGRASAGLLIQAAACLVLAVGFKLDSIASIGSAVALVIFTMITAAHLRIRGQTGANLLMLILAIAAAGAVLVTFVFITLIHEPASIITLAGILVLSIGLDYGWKRGHTGTPSQIQAGGAGH